MNPIHYAEYKVFLIPLMVLTCFVVFTSKSWIRRWYAIAIMNLWFVVDLLIYQGVSWWISLSCFGVWFFYLLLTRPLFKVEFLVRKNIHEIVLLIKKDLESPNETVSKAAKLSLERMKQNPSFKEYFNAKENN